MKRETVTKEKSHEAYIDSYRTKYDDEYIQKGDIELTKKFKFNVKNKFDDVNAAMEKGYNEISELVNFRLFKNLGGKNKGMFYAMDEMFNDMLDYDKETGRLFIEPPIINCPEHKDYKYILACIDYTGEIKKGTVVYPIHDINVIADKILSPAEYKTTEPTFYKPQYNMDLDTTLREYQRQMEYNRACLIAMKISNHRVNLQHQIYAVAFDKDHNVDIIKLDVRVNAKIYGYRGISRNTRKTNETHTMNKEEALYDIQEQEEK